MLFQFPSLVALSTLSLLGLASTSIAGHGRPHRHIHRSRITLGDETLGAPKISRAEGDSVEVPASELHLLRTETSAFQQWMGAWLDLENATDRESSVALLRQEIQAYEGWMNAWLDSASSSGNTPPPPLPSSIPIILPITHASSSLVLSTRFLNTTTPSSATISVVKSSPAVTTSTSSTPGGQFFQEPSATIQPGPSSSSASLSEAQTSFITLTSQKPIESSSSSIPVATSIATVTPPVVSDTQSASATVAPSLSESAPTPRGSPPSGPGQFDAQSSRNVAVYYGQTEATSKTSLGEMCQNENTDIVILAFLTEFFGPGGFPGLNFGPACGGPSAKMTSAGASKLLDCPDMAAQIKQCQGLGKKVLLSLGGSLATSAFSSDSKATEFANQLWDLFGAGTGVGSGLRPFGDVRLDGFDVDNEDHSTSGYSTFVSSLRTAMNADSSKTYYISAAPQCPRPDASIPLDAMQSMDFVFVQFYNNGDCNIGATGFTESFKAWSSDLSAKGAGPKLYIGAPGCETCAGSGYLDANSMASAVANAKSAGVSNFGGIMLWDGPEALANVQDGKDYTAVVKGALQ